MSTSIAISLVLFFISFTYTGNDTILPKASFRCQPDCLHYGLEEEAQMTVGAMSYTQIPRACVVTSFNDGG